MKKIKPLPILTKFLPVFILIGLTIVALAMFTAEQRSSPGKTVEFSTETGMPVNESQSSAAELPDQMAPDERQLIGYWHKGVLRGEKLSNGATDLGGGLLSNEDYGVTRFAKGKKFMLWLEKIVDRGADGVPEWEVKDVLIFDKLKKNQRFLFSYSSPCTTNGREDLDLIVQVEAEANKRRYKILKAWRANTETEKFETVSIQNIVCAYEKKNQK